MRSILYWNRGFEIVPIVVNITNQLNRVDVYNPNIMTLSKLKNGKKNSSEGLLYSVIFNKQGRINFKYGDNHYIKLLTRMLNEEQQFEFLYKGTLSEGFINLSDGTTLETNDISPSTGSCTQIKGVIYKVDKENYLFTNNKTFGRQYKIKTLNDFAHKKLNLETKDYKKLESYEDIKDYVDLVLRENPDYTSMDTETTSLIFRPSYNKNGKIVCFTHSYKENQGVMVLINHKGQELMDIHKVMDIFNPLLELNTVWQNGSFDNRVFRSYGYRFYLCHELLNLLQIANPDPSEQKALKHVCKYFMDEDTIELDEILGPNFNAELVEWIDEDLLLVYACGDTDKTLTTFKKVRETLSKEQINLYEHDMYNYNLIALADWYGFPASEELLSKLYNSSKEDVEQMEKFIKSYILEEYKHILARDICRSLKIDKDNITPKVIKAVQESDVFKKEYLIGIKGKDGVLDIDNNTDKYKIFVKMLKYPVTRYTDKGNVSIGADYFKDLDLYNREEQVEIMSESLYSSSYKYFEGSPREILIDKDDINSKVFPLGRMYIEYAKAKNKFVIYRRLRNNFSNGRTFSDYRYASTATGRVTNGVQTIAKYAKYCIGHDPSSKWGMVVFDFNQEELRLAHNEALRMWKNSKSTISPKIYKQFNPQEVIDSFNSFESDPHTETIAKFHNKTPAQVTSSERNAGKRVVFGSVYGATAYTNAKEELAKAKTDEDRQEIIRKYADTNNALLQTNPHLNNFFTATKMMPMKRIPPEEYPFNIPKDFSDVGKTMARTGRVRYYKLKDLDDWGVRHTQNQGRNQYIQSYARDITFLAIQRLTKYLYKLGYTEDDFRSLLFIHDEDGMEYDKTKFNPLWLAAVIFNCCCIELEDHPIKYYCAPAIANNWGEAKNDDRLEIPLKMLSKLSIDPRDYEKLDTLNHRDYVLQKITDYYYNEVREYLADYIKDNTLVIEDLDVETRYNFFKKLKDFIKVKNRYHTNPAINTLLCIMNDMGEFNSLVIKSDIKIIQLQPSNSKTEEKTYLFNDLDDLSELDDLNDLDNLIEDDGYSNEDEYLTDIINTSELVKTVVNRKTLAELDKIYINKNKKEHKLEHVYNYLFYQKFNSELIVLIGNTKGTLNNEGFRKVDKILKELNSPNGIHITYYLMGKFIPTNICIPNNFNFEKFDKFLELLMRENCNGR